MKKEVILFLFAFVLISSILFISSQNSDSSSTSEWLMFGRTLGHSGWDGNNFSTILGKNNINFTTSNTVTSSIIINGNLYVSAGGDLYQLNASDISQQIATYNLSGYTFTSPVVIDNYLYVGATSGGVGGILLQLNASDISQQIANYSTPNNIPYPPVIINNSLFVGDSNNVVGNLYQLNASNISQQINNYSIGPIRSSPAIADGYIYVSGGIYSGKGGGINYLYQLNASNISQQINYYNSLSANIASSPAVANGYVYVGDDVNHFYQLNASNISQQISTFVSSKTTSTSPAVANGYVYVSIYTSADGTLEIDQLNASNISQQIANFVPLGGGSDAQVSATNNNIYFGTTIGGGLGGVIYQLNASNISQQISNLSTPVGTFVSSSPAITKDYVYMGMGDIVYQLNATDLGLQNVCFESWSCSAWSDCSGGIQTRSCSDANACGTTASKPTETQTCSTGGHLAPQPQPQPSGGGGGSVTIYRPIVNVSSAAPVQITINSTKMDLTGITLSLKKSVENASMNITKVDQTEFLLFGLPIGKLYQLFQIEPTGIVSSDILNATLDFRINKTFLAENNITFHHRDNRYWLVQNDIVGNIAVYRMPTGSNGWMQLATNYTGEDNESYLFKAYTPGFSTFAIFFNKYDCLPNSARCSEDEVQLCLGNATWLVTDHCADTCDNGKCTVSFYKSGQFKFLIGTILTGIFAIVLIRVIHNRRKKIKKELTRKERREIRKNKRKIRREIRKKK